MVDSVADSVMGFAMFCHVLVLSMAVGYELSQSSSEATSPCQNIQHPLVGSDHSSKPPKSLPKPTGWSSNIRHIWMISGLSPSPSPSHPHPIPQPLPRLFIKRCRGVAVAARPGFVSPQRARRALRARRRGAADRPGGAQEALGAGGWVSAPGKKTVVFMGWCWLMGRWWKMIFRHF